MAADTPVEYIKHHLTNLTYGKLPEGYERADGSVVQEATWTFARTGQEAADMGFMALHVDTLGWSIAMGILFLGLFRFVANRRARTVGLEEPFPGAKNVSPWLDEQATLRKEKNFFETRVIEYQTGAQLEW